MEKYTNKWAISGRLNPHLLILMIDKSGSMNELLENGQTRSEMVASVINRTIEEIIKRNQQDGKVKDRTRIVIISYSNEVKIEKAGLLTDLFNNPLEVVEVEQKVPDGNGGLVTIKKKQRIWTKPIGKDEQGCTCMAEAFAVATRILKEIVSPESYPPIIVNITDGYPQFPIETIDYTEENMVEVLSSSIEQTKQQVKELSAQGKPIIFNLCFGEGTSIVFPIKEDLQENDFMSKFMYDISSKMQNSTPKEWMYHFNRYLATYQYLDDYFFANWENQGAGCIVNMTPELFEEFFEMITYLQCTGWGRGNIIE